MIRKIGILCMEGVNFFESLKTLEQNGILFNVTSLSKREEEMRVRLPFSEHPLRSLTLLLSSWKKNLYISKQCEHQNVKY